jgi:hypothetical protein
LSCERGHLRGLIGKAGGLPGRTPAVAKEGRVTLLEPGEENDGGIVRSDHILILQGRRRLGGTVGEVGIARGGEVRAEFRLRVLGDAEGGTVGVESVRHVFSEGEQGVFVIGQGIAGHKSSVFGLSWTMKNWGQRGCAVPFQARRIPLPALIVAEGCGHGVKGQESAIP